jgi:hypothetical protein
MGMVVTVIGAEARNGVKSKDHKPYDFVMLYVTGEKPGVQGLASDKVYLDRLRQPALCAKVEKEIAIGQIVELCYQRELGSTFDVLVDVLPAGALPVVDDGAARKSS